MSIEFTERVGAIPVYPAAESYGYEGELTKLASNETPYPPHPAVLEAVRSALGTLNRYPDPTAAVLRRRLADRHGVPQAKIAVGNGSCEILLAAAEAMLEPGAEIVYAWPSFSMYPHLAAMTGARAVTVPLDAAGAHDLDALAREVTVATRIVIVCNPNNPSATALAVEEVDAFVAGLPRHVLVIVDEAYVEFSVLQDPDESLALLDRHPNVVLLAPSRRSTVSAACAPGTRSVRSRFASGSIGCASRSRSTRWRRLRRPRPCATRTRSSAGSSAR